MRSPGTIMIEVKMPENAPAQNNCDGVMFSCLSPEDKNIRFPSPKPKKLIANIGATPVIGAAIPRIIKNNFTLIIKLTSLSKLTSMYEIHDNHIIIIINIKK